MAASFFFVMAWLQIGSERHEGSLVDRESIRVAACQDRGGQCVLSAAGADTDGVPVTVKEFRARMTLAIATYVSMTLSIVVIVFSLLEVRRSRWPWLWLAGGALLVGFYLSGTPPFDAGEQIFPAYHDLIISADGYRSCGCRSGSGASNVPWDSRLSSNRIGNALLVLAVIALSVSVWQQILGLRGIASAVTENDDAREKAARELRSEQRRFEFRLYLVSAMLVSSVIAVHSFYSWPAAIVLESIAQALAGLATTIAIVFGAGFTLFILIVFGPAYFAINEKVRELAESAVGPPGEDESLRAAVDAWREKNDFAVKAHQRVFGMLATAGPLLAGPIMDLLKVVSA